MALPRQVEAQLKELEAIEKQLTGEVAPAEQHAAEQHAAEPQAELDKVEAPVAEATPVEAKPTPAEPEVAEETWQQKYRTLKGMYDAEVPRLHAQMKELNARVEQMQRDAQTPKQEAVPEQPKKLVTDDDVAAFGADLIEVQRKVAREVAAEFTKDIESLRAENDKLREQLMQTGQQVSAASFEQKLFQLVPNFQKVNADPKWIAWLDEVDPLIRAPRKTVAQEAFNRGDADAVAYYVQMFEASQAPVEQAKPRTAELERQIQPSRSAATTATPTPKGKTFTNSDIQAMFNKASQMARTGRLDEARKLEAEIDAAFMDGRVVA